MCMTKYKWCQVKDLNLLPLYQNIVSQSVTNINLKKKKHIVQLDRESYLVDIDR